MIPEICIITLQRYKSQQFNVSYENIELCTDQYYYKCITECLTFKHCEFAYMHKKHC